ncbi:META domain-containing protein [Roseovarius spongiae]|uniref:META domain-containing protein n=1 Tax=Roseovarius spongiae TaxID=2320272 RepID=A0A3A8B9B6_9RHOB|nr:META domain-containing protein [Roseovarius spongiae]RKF14693.1 META domain-containing protein [Roseovarius spongiae]
MRRALLLAASLGLTGCQGDQTVTGHGGAGAWELTLIAGAAPPASLTMRLLDDGAVEISGPCNTMRARQTAPYPWFHLTDAVQTERACAALEQEERLFDALAAASLVEVAGDVLIITTSSGKEMVLEARRP